MSITRSGLLEATKDKPGYGAMASGFDVLQRLYVDGERDWLDRYSDLARMRWHDIFFALALFENEIAQEEFDSTKPLHGRSRSEAEADGLSAAISAAKAYMFGVSIMPPTAALH